MKILHIEIKCCDDCPYMEFEGNYQTNAPSEYECKKKYKRVGLYTESKEFEAPPEWCPLPNKK